jgi:predicted unusual protein kinase regulating ubiquinone biosynthesis (AarF/ABC1/UbiB family)
MNAFVKDKSRSSRSFADRSYLTLGRELSAFHNRFRCGHGLLGNTMVHADLHWRNVFYAETGTNASSGHTTFIDNDAIADNFCADPFRDIFRVVMFPFGRTVVYDGIWVDKPALYFDVVFNNFVVGYASSFASNQWTALFSELSIKFNRKMYFHDVNSKSLKLVVKLVSEHLNPRFDRLLSKLLNESAVRES